MVDYSQAVTDATHHPLTREIVCRFGV